MVRFLLLVLAALISISTVSSQELGRTDRAWREYLYQTVRLGLPLFKTPLTMAPYWPVLDRFIQDARVLEPSADTDLLTAWVELQEGDSNRALALLKAGWPKPDLTKWPARFWGEALFAVWPPGDKEWTDAWLAWQDKAYSPAALVRGLEVFEKTDVSAVEPLLRQAVQLYPDDRRFLPLIARHPSVVNDAKGLVARDLAAGGWSIPALRALLDRSPQTRAFLIDAGYDAPKLDAATAGDYGVWLGTDAEQPSDGTWRWDADQDGRSENWLTFEGGQLTAWSRRAAGGVWTLAFRDGKPDTLTESRDGSSWTLRYESYPYALTLEYRWAGNVMLYRFPPLAQAVPLWPAERFTAPLSRLPSVLAELWIPLNPQALARAASTVEEWHGNFRAAELFLYRGEVWMEIEDSDGDGVDDTWSYYRAGKLASVYRDLEGRGTATLREVYDKGLLTQVLAKGKGNHTDFALFPQEGIQLWDPHAQGRPLDRVFVWQGDRLDALVFSGQSLPWATMPAWEPRP